VQTIDVVGAYLLVAVFLLPVTLVYRREEASEVAEASPVEHRLPSNPAFQSLFD
jgi:hypothetical protein